MIRHAICGYPAKRFAVVLEAYGNRLEIKQLQGQPAPPASAALLRRVLEQIEFPSGQAAWELAFQCHAQRKSRYAVEEYVGMSGSRDYRLRVEADAALGDFPIVAAIHVSMYGKLNNGLSIHLMDLPPLLEAAALGAYDDEAVNAFLAEHGEVKVVNPFEREFAWITPSRQEPEAPVTMTADLADWRNELAEAFPPRLEDDIDGEGSPMAEAFAEELDPLE